MLIAGELFLVGIGVTAAGVLWSGFYDIGIMLMLLAAIGLAVRVGDWARIAFTSGRGTPRAPQQPSDVGELDRAPIRRVRP